MTFETSQKPLRHLPPSLLSQVEHKIQSGAGPLDIHLARVPKMIPLLRSLWCPAALLVSFKVRLSTPLLPLPSLPLSCHTLFETVYHAGCTIYDCTLA
ncbi:unnamed protein product [Closterium sp. NIES-54]